jgi:NAD(P)-dependent dehydrogenase (short-subunit alcohol dehydrogenase family)
VRVLITGAAGGLGRAFCAAFAERDDEVIGADLAAAFARRADAAPRADAPPRRDNASPRVTEVAVDVADGASVAAMAAEIGPIDVLVNNAAIYAGLTRAPFHELTEAEWDRVMAVNAKGPWLCAKHCTVRDGGAIINVSSATVLSGSPQWAHYVASKAALLGLTRVMARELGERGVRVNALAPGFTLTDASRELIDDAETYGLDRGALKRGATPEDIVGAALFLASAQSAFITGQTLVVDGGRQFL